MYGWKGALLKINLSSHSWKTVHPNDELYKEFIGGRGLAGHYLRPYMYQPWHHNEMPLIFMTGPLVDTAAPTSGRMCIMSKSPLTGAICDTSVGGRLATQIKRSGYDGIILTGKSETFTGISISNNSVEFISIKEMKGKTTEEISALLPDSGSTAFVGPAAYSGVRFASIAVDSHFFSGRGGLGLVMAEKKVAYLSVHGNEKTVISDNAILKESREQIMRLTAASPILEGELGIGNYGTGTLYDLTSSRHMMPTENFKGTYFNSHNKCNAVKMHKKYKPKKTGCAGCHILCKQKAGSGDFLPEFETLSHFSALLDNSNLETIFEANRLCNHYGMDTITTAVTLAAYAEIEKKKLTPKEILETITLIATSKGIGKKLKMGSLHYACELNQEEVSMTVKGLELPAYDPRGAYGMALAYATSTRGGCHLRAYPISHEILRKPAATDRFSFSGKARIIKINEDANAVIDSLTACKFIFFGATLEEYARALEGVTGVHYTAQELLSIGHKIIYNEHVMNVAAGLDGTGDTLPQRFFTQKGSSAEDFDVPPIDKREFQNTIQKYYKIRKLSENGMPIPDEVKRLGL